MQKVHSIFISIIMNLIKFAFYYLNLQIKIRFGKYQTENPLRVKWRWQYWNEKQQKQSRIKKQSILRNDIKNVWRKFFY